MADARALLATARARACIRRHVDRIRHARQILRRRLATGGALAHGLGLWLFLVVDSGRVAQPLVGVGPRIALRQHIAGFTSPDRIGEQHELRLRHRLALLDACEELLEELLELDVARSELVGARRAHGQFRVVRDQLRDERDDVVRATIDEQRAQHVENLASLLACATIR